MEKRVSGTSKECAASETGKLHKEVAEQYNDKGSRSKLKETKEIRSKKVHTDTNKRKDKDVQIREPRESREESKITSGKQSKVKIKQKDNTQLRSERTMEVSNQRKNIKGSNQTNEVSVLQKEGKNDKTREDDVKKKPIRSSNRAAAKLASMKISETAYSDVSSPKPKRKGRPRKK